jgi:hypothetical protein
MSVEDPSVIDLLSFNEASGTVRLTMTEHRVWDEGNHHLLQVQEKLNAYLAYVEGGQLHRDHPEWGGKPVEISLAHRYPLCGDAELFVRRVQEWLPTTELGDCVSFTAFIVDESNDGVPVP